MDKVITFGEIMLRLSTGNNLRFSQAREFTANYGGGEYNVAVSLANYGIKTEFVTRLPENELGNICLAEMRKNNVDSNHVISGGSRLGLYFLETGAASRGSSVIYDRAYSAFSEIEPGMVDWEEVFKGATWFHWSGVTPAVSQSAAEACLEAVKTASKMGLTISADLNYRSKLWRYGKEPKKVMPELLKYSHVILGDLDTAFFMLGEKSVNPDYQNADSLPELYNRLFDRYPDLKLMATTLRYSVNASHQRIGGILYDGKKVHTAEVRDVAPVVDRVGSGDAFMGGLIYGLISAPEDTQRSLNLAVAACCLKHTIPGDINLINLTELEKMAAGDASGKVIR
ncbi:sugar kinase [Gramella sp. AN32]|uniref:PfkB family carbohydrate kinase n=1 Tax=Christiangramia antarctica TaxID=2058158 RepID=A0ABW5X864_9FLAO|nr:sugar kinase [Gramella sp. AN32]MCM4154849.1 2-dehydro-3-deoxygluconokinase [Gramella sp. AN32]